MKVGYIRVSTKEQNTIRQECLMKNLDVDKIYIEKISGKNLNRPELRSMLEYLRDGDILIVESISRLARNTKDLLEILEKLDNKNVQFVSKKENIDTSTPTGKFMITVFGAVAELERNYIKERQKEGLEIARQQGKQLGRPKIEYPENWKIVYKKWKNGKIKSINAMKELNLKKNTFYNLIKRYENDI